MLGSLPSTYLKWVSKKLRAEDMEEWAKMVDLVLDDPVYRDRIEWEAAEKILNGDTGSRWDGRNAVTELLEISERFGWDNEDKRRWSRIDFGLLGTSKGGRIPRVGANQSDDAGVVILKKKTTKEVEGGRERRRERRERVRRKPQEEEEESVGEGDRSSTAAKGVVRSPFSGREVLLKNVLNYQGFVDL